MFAAKAAASIRSQAEAAAEAAAEKLKFDRTPMFEKAFSSTKECAEWGCGVGPTENCWGCGIDDSNSGWMAWAARKLEGWMALAGITVPIRCRKKNPASCTQCPANAGTVYWYNVKENCMCKYTERASDSSAVQCVDNPDRKPKP